MQAAKAKKKRKELFYDLDANTTFNFGSDKIIKFSKGLLLLYLDSQPICEMLYGPLKENVIDIKDFGYDEFKLFLDCVMGFERLTKKNAIIILPIAAKYLATNCLKKCAAALKPLKMDEEVCLLLNLALYHNCREVQNVVKDFILNNGFTYTLIENESLCNSLTIESLKEVLKWIEKIDSYTLNTILCWCNHYIEDSNSTDCVKDLLNELGIAEQIKPDIFESGLALQEFCKSEVGKDFFTVDEILEYFNYKIYSQLENHKWVKLLKGQEYREKCYSVKVNKTDLYIQFGEVLAYEFKNIDKLIECTITNETSTKRSTRRGYLNKEKNIFYFNIEKWIVRDGSPLDLTVAWTFNCDCRILVSNHKPYGISKISQDRYFFSKKLF